MADYPTLDQLRGSRFEAFDGTIVQSSQGGERVVLPAFKLATAGRIGRFRLLHDVDSTDRTTLVNHFTTDRRNSFNFVFDALADITWTCVWGPTRPQFRRVDKLSTRWIAECILWATTNDE
jgi:hypothetical protein